MGDTGEFYRRVIDGYRLNELGASTNSVIASFDLDAELIMPPQALVTYPGYDNGHGRVDLYGADATGEWNLLQTYTHDSGDPTDLFPYYGWSVSISGGTFLVGAFGREVGSNLYQGASYFYTRDALFADGFDGG